MAKFIIELRESIDNQFEDIKYDFEDKIEDIKYKLDKIKDKINDYSLNGFGSEW